MLWKLSDARLVRRSQRGDSSAFVILLQRFDDRLRELVYSLVLDGAAMDRVLRAAYIKAWRDVVRTGSDFDVGVWLYRLAYNAAIDELRHEQHRWDAGSAPDSAAGSSASDAPARSLVGDSAEGSSVDAAGEPSMMRELSGDPDRVVTALAAVPPDERLALVLVDREEFSPAAAARIVGLTQDTFDQRLSAARARLSHALATTRRLGRPRPERRRPAPSKQQRVAVSEPGGDGDGRAGGAEGVADGRLDEVVADDPSESMRR